MQRRKTKNIWKAKVKPKSNLTKKEYPIIVYTYDYEDKDDVKRVLHYLLRNNLTLGKTIYYKLDKQTRNNIYSGNNQERPWIYSSQMFLLSEYFD